MREFVRSPLLVALLMGVLWFSACDAQELSVYTESSPPYQVIDESGQVSGVATERVRQLLERAGLDGNFYLYPWARAIHLARGNAQSLIYSIARTSEREKDFVWITPVAEFNLALVSLSKRSDIQINDWSDLARYSIAAQRDDVGHHWLETRGLKEGENFLACSDIQCSWHYLLKESVDLIIEDPELIEETARRIGVPETRLRTVRLIPELSLTGFLAANRQIDPEILQRLQRAARPDDAPATPE